MGEPGRVDKRLLDTYRDAARKIYERDGLTIPNFGGVQVMADGAFVEATVWVPLLPERE